MKIISSVMSAVYRKSLVLSNSAKQLASYGDLTNLMAVDCQHNFHWLAYTVCIPLQILLTTGLLYTEFGLSSLALIMVVPIILTIQSLLTKLAVNMETKQLKHLDHRIGLTNEILNGIKILKLYGWEQPFSSMITKLRDQELLKIRKIYFNLDEHNNYVTNNKDINDNNNNIVDINGATLSWDTPNSETIGDDDVINDYTLNQIDLHIREGMFVAIVGDVGSGKSSLLSAIIGDMKLIAGTVNIRSNVSIAYVPQQAWIQNATIKQNIMFGKPFDEELYDRVIDSCALRPDLRQLAGGDQTEIGEKGVTLSGGQKQRVSLGRAVYSGADLYLLDDPLSAVDSHVGKHLMTEVLDSKTGILGSKTRLLVTNQLFMLADCDLIVVLKAGKIVSTGTYGQLLSDSYRFLYALSIISTCIRLHRQLLASVMHAPMEFFDTTPVGRLLNRFNKDMNLVDINLPVRFSLESISRSPIYSHLGDTINGLSSIRAYDCMDRFILESDNRIDQNLQCIYPSILANSWLLIRLQVLSNLLVLFAALFGVIGKDSLTGSDIGLSLANAITLTGILEYFIDTFAQTQGYLVSFERIDEYCRLKSEANWQSGQQLSDKWPEKGYGYGTRYRQGLDLVIKGIDIDIKSGEKIGIVGRTGAGKSSLTLALFRLIEPAMGRIVIDGIDISQLGLHELRSRLTIIPQEPVLFSGTIRSNLDPFDKFSDDELWSVLEQSHLKEFVLSTDAGLDHPVTESGDNMSVGQRQLVCLARALLRHTSILILDEATAAVDVETDSLIQQTIRQSFKSCTVLTIAHRINTILDYDRVLVLSDGRVAEFDSPDQLLDDRTTIFYSLAKDAGVI
ncbi:multidrug resistance-associated protein 1-like [Oppia nitens]|uniref:multidrug resistance-associated protein 1-like n=1 Tax=Oppia nitens TaxID=1686743 RepID=UPI0023DB7AD3|nr:multidrug resistance-associated protein 1-like [Oppia nitens]